MPRKEKKLVKWIIDGLNKGKFEWFDRDQRQFRLPWPRQKCKKWDECDSWFIIDYIKMQGSFKEGDKKQFVPWKARLRTALNKEKALKEIKEERNNDGKVYQIVHVPKGCEIRSQKIKTEPVTEYNYIGSCFLLKTDGLPIEVNMSDEDSGIGSPDSYTSSELIADFNFIFDSTNISMGEISIDDMAPSLG